ncbi:MAG: hypothetical protein ACR2NB_05790 [Solirubrobacteraceae bacterium]
MDLLSPFVRDLSGPGLASEFARARLGASRGRRPTVVLADAAALGSAVGLGASEMQRVGGCSRQTIYNVLRADRLEPPELDLELEMLACALAFDGESATAVIADRLRVDLGGAVRAAGRLVARDEIAAAARPVLPATLVAATERGEGRLREVLDEVLRSRPEGIAVYLFVATDEEGRALERTAEALIAHQEHVLLDASIAPSTMRGPELALVVHAASMRSALEIAEDVWNDLRDRADLAPALMRVASILPPAALEALPSDVLDAFVAGIVSTAPRRASDAARRARNRFDGRARERELAARCLTAAASSLRLALGRPSGAPAISDGDRAFGELSVVADLHLDADRERIQRPLVRALDLACERLGPVAGGRLGSVRAPGARPAEVESVHPTEQDLAAMAEDSGAAVGAAAALGVIDTGNVALSVALATG